MLDTQDPINQLNITKPHVKNLLKDLLAEMNSFKYQITFQITFPKEAEHDGTKYSLQIYFDSNTQTVINDLDINDSLENSYQIVLPRV